MAGDIAGGAGVTVLQPHPADRPAALDDGVRHTGLRQLDRHAQSRDARTDDQRREAFWRFGVALRHRRGAALRRQTELVPYHRHISFGNRLAERGAHHLEQERVSGIRQFWRLARKPGADRLRRRGTNRSLLFERKIPAFVIVHPPHPAILERRPDPAPLTRKVNQHTGQSRDIGQVDGVLEFFCAQHARLQRCAVFASASAPRTQARFQRIC